jgi:cyclomaltodextrinase / maltogenic alpha-amylase / neopullulanase
MTMNKKSTMVMQDFVFGGIETDSSLLLETEQNRWRGIRHLYQAMPLDPKPGEAVSLTVTVGQDVHVDRLTAYVTTDGSDPEGSMGVARNGFAVPLHRVDVKWQPLVWDYVEIWQGEIPGQPDGALVHYRIEGHSQSATRNSPFSIWSREMNMDRTQEQAALYGYHVDEFEPPTWAREAILYQIFVDRFARGITGEAVKDGWLTPAEMNKFMGGDLQGITARLDYIADLGATAVWLTPIFVASSYHAYDTADYFEIDPRFGTKEDLRALVQAAHARGLRVILDFVANHTSSEAPIFKEALHDPASPYRDWFTFDASYKHGYRSFFDVASMPQFNVDNREVRRFLCDAAAYWLREFDIDGYRLDYAAGPSHSFWSEFGAACKRAKEDSWLFGEVTGMGDLLRSYAGRLDGCLDFGFARTVRQLCTGDEPNIPPSRFVTLMERSRRFFPEEYTLPSFLDNHDMNRFLWVAGDDEQRLRLALGLLFAFGQQPILYYGTEIGLGQPRAKGPHREEARHPMPWGKELNNTLLGYTNSLIQLRKQHPALVYGEIQTHLLDEERQLWLARRSHGDDVLWIAVNVGGRDQPILLPSASFVDLLTGEQIHMEWVLSKQSVRFLLDDKALLPT